MLFSLDVALVAGASASTVRTNTAIADMEWSDWQIAAQDIEVARRDDGREWKLGGESPAHKEPPDALTPCLSVICTEPWQEPKPLREVE